MEGRQVEKEEFQHNQEVKFHEAKSSKYCELSMNSATMQKLQKERRTLKFTSVQTLLPVLGGCLARGWGVLPYISYIGMCRPIGCCAVLV